MAEMQPFNSDLDKITEREVVPDFVSRLKIGKKFLDENGHKLFDENSKLKDDILLQIIKSINTYDIFKISIFKTSYTVIEAGSKNAAITVPESANIYKIIQEKTGLDVTECFKKITNKTYVAEFASAIPHQDIFKAYYTIE